MKYLVIQQRENCGDEFVEEFATRQEALNYAEEEWQCLTDIDKKHLDSFYVLESVNPDEEAENHFDGNPIKTYK